MDNFINSEAEYIMSGSTIQINTSKIFYWFKGDFNGNQGIIDLHKKFMPKLEKNSIKDTSISWKLNFKEYDWDIQEKYNENDE